MKAIVWTAYGPPDVLQLKEVPKPIPKENEVLIKIHASTVTAGDSEVRRMQIPILFRFPMRMYVGFARPKRITVLGTEVAGEVEAVGEQVKSFQVGDQVFGSAGFEMGANAEYICLPEDGQLAIKPSNMSYDEAATVPFGGRDALHFLRKASIRHGQKVLINGAGGSIGVFAIQIAKHFGAEVTAVDSAAKLEVLRSLGADHVVDYTQEDFTQRGEIYDVIFDVVGKSPYSRSLKMLSEDGYYLLANPAVSHMIRGLWTSRTSGRTVVSTPAGESTEDLVFLRDLIETGTIRTVIDRRYPLDRVAEAHRYVETGAKLGNVVITVGSAS
jgi:NADPH:quinone reductase-like Zn-dependent oxidoreductase